MRGVTSTRASIKARAVMIVAQSPCFSPACAASSGETSVNNSGCSSLKCESWRRHSARSVMLGEPVRRENVWKACILRRSIRIIIAFFAIRRRIR